MGNLPSPSTPSSFSSCGVIAEGNGEEDEEETERMSLDVPLISTGTNIIASPTTTNIIVSAPQPVASGGPISNLLGLNLIQPATTAPTTVVDDFSNQGTLYRDKGCSPSSPDGSAKGSEGSEVEWL
jgi:hypothetical protein